MLLNSLRRGMGTGARSLVYSPCRMFSASSSNARTTFETMNRLRGGPLKSAFPQEKPPPADGKQTVGYVLHGQFTRNNIILTLTRRYRRVGKLAEGLSPQELAIDRVRPRQDVLISLSTGMLGYRNTKQGQYEAAYATTARMFQLIEQRKLTDKELEIVFRQFSEGREAFVNCLNGKEGTRIRPLVTRVTDATKIKFGGDRPRAKRRV